MCESGPDIFNTIQPMGCAIILSQIPIPKVPSSFGMMAKAFFVAKLVKLVLSITPFPMQSQAMRSATRTESCQGHAVHQSS